MNGWKKSGMLVLALVLLAPAVLFYVPLNEAVETVDVADHPVNLYMYINPNRLSTELPSIGLDTIGGSIIPGRTLTYNLTYPLTEDLFISAPMEEGVRYLIVHLQDSYLRPGVTGLTLRVQINAWGDGSSPVQIASTEFDQTEMVNDDLKVPMIASDGYKVKVGSVIELRLSLSGTGTIPAFLFTNIGTSGAESSSHVYFLANPIPSNGVGLRMLDPDGFELNAIIPNGPEELRTVDFRCSVRDAFGAYDVKNITLVVRSSEGNVLHTIFTDEPEPSGGEPVAYFNDTIVFAEGNPVGVYDVIVTGNSWTGQSVTYTGKLEVRSGLFISLESSELEAGSGDTVTFRMRVLNGGSSTDRVSFTGTSDKGWTVNPPEAVEIDGGDETVVEFRVVVPIRVALRTESNITMEAASRNADRAYSEVGKVVVTGVSTFGAEVITGPSANTFAGTAVDFDIKVVNLLDELRSFELSPEALPASWSVSFSGSNGSSQGSLYLFTVGPLLEAIVRLTVTPPAQSSGRTEFKAYVRAQGETEKKYLFLSVSVVDAAREIATLVGDDSRTAVRKGTSYPVEFNKLFFTAELYNPTLQALNLDVDISAKEGWTAALDFGDIELSPGSGALLNATITPPKGALYNDGAPYTFTLTADAGITGEKALILNVLVPAVHKVEALPEKSVIDVKEGSSAPLNVTVKNRGNTDGKVEIAITSDKGVTVVLQPLEADIGSGQEFVFRGQVEVGSLDEATVYTITIEYTYQGKKESVQVTISAQPEDEDDGIPWIKVLIGAGALLALLGAAFLVFLIARKKAGKRTVKETKEPAPQVTVQAVKEVEVPKNEPPTAKEEVQQTFEAVEVVEPPVSEQPTAPEPEDEEKAADTIMNQILGEEPPAEETEVVEAKLVG